MAKIKVAIVVAVSKNGIIGRDGDMPWRLSTDLKRFKALTLGKPVIMGRKTYDTIGKPLPGRLNVVISRQPGLHIDGVECASSLEDAVGKAFSIAKASGATEICVIGGGQIYRQAVAIADELFVTHVEADVDGDTAFPAIDPDVWQIIAEENVPAGEKDSYPTRFVRYLRRL